MASVIAIYLVLSSMLSEVEEASASMTSRWAWVEEVGLAGLELDCFRSGWVGAEVEDLEKRQEISRFGVKLTFERDPYLGYFHPALAREAEEECSSSLEAEAGVEQEPEPKTPAPF